MINNFQKFQKTSPKWNGVEWSCFFLHYSPTIKMVKDSLKQNEWVVNSMAFVEPFDTNAQSLKTFLYVVLAISNLILLHRYATGIACNLNPNWHKRFYVLLLLCLLLELISAMLNKFRFHFVRICTDITSVSLTLSVIFFLQGRLG